MKTPEEYADLAELNIHRDSMASLYAQLAIASALVSGANKEEEIPAAVHEDIQRMNPDMERVTGRVVFDTRDAELSSTRVFGSGRNMLDREVRDLLLRGYRVVKPRNGAEVAQSNGYDVLVEDATGDRFALRVRMA